MTNSICFPYFVQISGDRTGKVKVDPVYYLKVKSRACIAGVRRFHSEFYATATPPPIHAFSRDFSDGIEHIASNR